MIKGIIFDMDGVLFDTEPFYFKRRETFLGIKGISIQDKSPKDFIGGHMEQVWKEILGQELDQESANIFLEDYNAYKLDHKAPYSDLIFPEVNETLMRLRDKGLKLALASNSNKEDVLSALDQCQLKDYFSVILAREDVLSPKPNPEIYEKAHELLSLEKDSLVVIEDSEKGIQAGKAAGLTVWAIKDYRYDINQEQADRLIDHLGDILESL